MIRFGVVQTLLLYTALGNFSSSTIVPTTTKADTYSATNHHQHPTEEQSRLSLYQSALYRRRKLGDFDSFNALFEGTIISIPDVYTTAGEVFGSTIELWMEDIQCFGISLDDIRISHRRAGSKLMLFDVEIKGLDIDCDFGWRYKWTRWFEGKGTGQVYTRGSEASTIIKFTSKNFDSHPPSGSSSDKDDCVAEIKIYDMDFQGGITAAIIDTFERSFRNRISSEINGVVCEELGSLGTTFVMDMLEYLQSMIENYLGPLPPELEDFLYAENNLIIPTDVNLVNLNTTDETVGTWFNSGLKQLDQLLGTMTADPLSPTGTGMDLGINKIIRQTMLDENRMYIVPISEWPDSVSNDGLLFHGHDMLTETTIHLTQIEVYGLDTFTTFDPLNSVGNYTLTNHFYWEQMVMKIGMKITMKPSSSTDSVIVEGSTDKLVENILVEIGIDDIDVDIHFMIAFIENKIGDLQLGSLFNTSQILPCFLNSIFAAEVTGLSASVLNIRQPVLTGFISKGIDRVITKSSNAVFDMYEATLLKAMPNFFEKAVRSMLNDFISGMILDATPDQCQTPDAHSEGDSSIDFRDFLLSPDNATALGGSGESPYGDFIYTVMEVVKNNFLASDPENVDYVMLNSMVVNPITKSQSGVEGMLSFQTELINYNNSNLSEDSFGIVESAYFHIDGLQITNLNTIHHPLTLLSPNSTNPQLLHNIAEMGSVDESDGEPVITTNIALVIDGDGPPFEMNNNMNISVSVPNILTHIDIEAHINTERLMTYPLRDLTNQHCLLSLFRISANDTASTALFLDHFLIAMSSLKINMECEECSSVGLYHLPDIFDTLESVGAFTVLGNGMSEVVTDLLEGEWVDNIVNYFQSNAPFACPHDPQFDESFIVPGLETLPENMTPKISRKSVEFGVYGGSLLMQVFAVVASLSHLQDGIIDEYESTERHLLDEESNLQLIDLTKMNDLIGVIWDLLVDELSSFLGKSSSIFIGENSDLGINMLLRSFILDDDNTIVIELDNMNLNIGHVDASLTQIRLHGLDSFNFVEVLNIQGPTYIMNGFSLERIHLDIDISLNMNDGSMPEIMTVSFGMKDVHLALGLDVGILNSTFSNLPLGALMNSNHTLSCFLSSIYSLQLYEFSVSVEEIEVPRIEGFLSKEIDDAIKASFNATFDEYLSTFISAMPKLSNSTIKPLANAILSSYLNTTANEHECPIQNMESFESYVNFGDLFLQPDEALLIEGSKGTKPYGDIIYEALSFVNKNALTDGPNGQSYINYVISRLTERMSGIGGTMIWDGNVIEESARIKLGDLKAKFEVKVSNITVEGLDSVGSMFRVFNPLNALTLENSASIGTGSNALSGSVRLFISLDNDDDTKIQNLLDIGLELEDGRIELDAMMKIVEKAFIEFPLKSISNLNCWLATLLKPNLNEKGVRINGDPSMSVEALSIVVSKLRLSVDCVNCTSPEFEVLADTISSPTAVEDLTEITNRLFEDSIDLLRGEWLQTQLDRLLSESSAKCHDPMKSSTAVYQAFNSPKQAPISMNIFIIVIAVLASLIFIFAFISILVRYLRRKRHELWFKTLTNDEVLRFQLKEEEEKNKQMLLNSNSQSMIRNPTIPLFVRILIPLVVFTNIGFFLSGHLSTGATVNVDVSLAGQDFTFDDVFTFSMLESIGDMIEAGSIELAVIIIIFSGVWPYTKQIISLLAFILPPQRLSVHRRESILLWLDSLGKWSFIDIFVLIMSVVSFRVIVNSPDDLSFLPADFYSVNLMVVPLWGLYANLIAQLISQFSSHVIIHYHRKIVQTYESDDRPGDAKKLCNHRFQQSELKIERELVPHNGTTTIIILMIATTSVLLICGCAFESFSLETLGLIGLAVESGNNFQEANVSHSLFTTTSLILEQATYLGGFANYLGLGTLSLVLISTVLLVPMFQLALICKRWFMPLDRKGRRRWFVLMESLNAWKYIEVYILSIIIATWQLGTISEFMINDYCDSFETAFAAFTYYGLISGEDAQCFRVNAQVQKSTWILLSAAVLLSILSHLVGKAALQQEEDEYNNMILEPISELIMEGRKVLDLHEVNIKPKAPRFVDYYRCLLRYPSKRSYSDINNSVQELVAIVGDETSM